jgi:hypothetical protein
MKELPQLRESDLPTSDRNVALTLRGHLKCSHLVDR